MNRDLPPLPEKRHIRTLVRGILASATVVVCLTGVGVQSGHADDLDDRRRILDQQLTSQAEQVDDATAAATSALAAYEAARDELADAEAALATARSRTREARELDSRRAAELADAEQRLVQAEADVAAAQAAYDSVDARTNEEITVITQQSGGLVELALLFGELGASDLNHQAQLSTTLLDASALELDELTSRRFALDAAQARADQARDQAAASRQSAADALAVTEAREQEAADLEAAVTDKVQARDSARAAAEAEVKAERQRQSELEAESADVDRRIAERIAAEEARRKAAEEAARREAARRAAAEEAARKAAAQEAARRAAAEEAARKAAADKAADRAAAEKGSPKPSTPGNTDPRPPAGPTSSAPKARPAANPVSSIGFARPVAGRLSSKYGMRLHPVLGYWKLHDGTDFAASCGAPIRAPYDGVVAERYYNAGYGNRLMVDHGRVGDTYVTTGYNHAIRYVVEVGDRVSKGQVLGYVGNTGYSTGCHLHLMVWENGAKVNPMGKWFD